MLVFSTSIAGSNRKQLEDGVVALGKENGKVIKIINLIDEMISIVPKFKENISPQDLLTFDRRLLETIKSAVINKIKVEINSNPKIDYILDAHTVFWWKNGPIQLVSIKDIIHLNPDLIITIVPRVKDINDHFNLHGKWLGVGAIDEEMLQWFELELYTADIFAEAIGKKNYVIGSHENPIVIYNLMYHPNMLKIYMSFAISHRKNNYKKLEAFIEKVRKFAIVFNPRSVDISLENSTNKLVELEYNQTVRRDFHFIDQSDILVVFLENLVYSSGVDSEKSYAYGTGKKVLMYFPFESHSPFTPYFSSEMFKNENNLLKRISEISKIKESGKNV